MLCRSSREEIPHAQGKSNPSKMVGVARGHQRTDTLKPYSQKTSQSYHTRTTALSDSMKPSHAYGATQDGRVMVERSDRMWSTGEGNGKPLQYSCLENPMNSMKRQNDRIPKVGRVINGIETADERLVTGFTVHVSDQHHQAYWMPHMMQLEEHRTAW